MNNSRSPSGLAWAAGVAFLFSAGWGCQGDETVGDAPSGQATSSDEDTQPPEVRVTELTPYQVVRETLSPTVQATDDVEVVRLQMLISDRVVATDDEPPLAVAWDTTEHADGVVTLQIVGWDAVGNRGASTPVRLVVLNQGVSVGVHPSGAGTLRIPHNYNGTQEIHGRHFWLIEQGFARGLGVVTWDAQDTDRPWTVELTLGKGTCPHQGTSYSPSGSGREGMVDVEIQPPGGLPVGAQLFAHVAPLDAADHRGDVLPYTLRLFALDPQGPGTDPNPEDSCPVNSRYPCYCSGVNVCQDGSDCVRFSMGAQEGACSARCAGLEDVTGCAETQGFGLYGNCSAGVDVDRPDHCIVVCEENGQSAACPPGMACVAEPDGGVCLPSDATSGNGGNDGGSSGADGPPCYGVPAEGCCRGSTVYFCEQGQLWDVECDPHPCGYSDALALVKCNGQDAAPADLELACPPTLPPMR